MLPEINVFLQEFTSNRMKCLRVVILYLVPLLRNRAICGRLLPVQPDPTFVQAVRVRTAGRGIKRDVARRFPSFFGLTLPEIVLFQEWVLS